MKLNQTILSSAVAVGLTLTAGSAFAQAEEAADEAPAAAEGEEAPAEEAAAEEAPAEEAAEEEAVEEEAVEEEAAEEEAVEEEATEEEAEEEAAEDAEAEEEEAEEESGGSPSLFVFGDAYAGWQSQKSGTPGGGGVYAHQGPGGTAESGFGLNWLGVDAGYDAGTWAVSSSIRAGDAVYQYGVGTLGGSPLGTGIGITNAYVTYRPVEGLALDMGTFGTIYGAEVAESWQNLNYTRGELYFNMQPFWHTGLRAEYATGDFVARALVVNDANTSNLGAGALNAGAQLGYDNGTIGAYAGLLQSLKPDTTVANGGFVDTFVDVVLVGSFGDLSIIGNFDMNAGYEAAAFWGASLAAGYQIVPAFGVAIRGEYLSSPDDFLYAIDADGDGNTDDADDSLITGTLTLDLKPAPEQDNFVVRLDGRIEVASEEAYLNGDATDTTDMWQSVTLGVVGYHDLL